MSEPRPTKTADPPLVLALPPPAPPEPTDDDQLMARVRAGDRDALEPLVRRYGGQLLAFLQTRLGIRADADDALQETWINVYTVAGEYHGGDFRAWLYSVARYKVLHEHTRRKRKRVHTTADGATPEGVVDADPAAGLINEEERAALERCVQKLPDDNRMRTVARYRLGGVPYEEIATFLGDNRSTNALTILMNAAKKFLQACVQGGAA